MKVKAAYEKTYQLERNLALVSEMLNALSNRYENTAKWELAKELDHISGKKAYKNLDPYTSKAWAALSWFDTNAETIFTSLRIMNRLAEDALNLFQELYDAGVFIEGEEEYSDVDEEEDDDEDDIYRR